MTSVVAASITVVLPRGIGRRHAIPSERHFLINFQNIGKKSFIQRNL